ncbi:hypothetical protein [Actinophytocola sp. NPDC049390]|uniref:hypothetical protein n=1 Tax=Actinophytocola sp. NPDC049390 TaxID=3363894 RepID=UPI00379A1288
MTEGLWFWHELAPGLGWMLQVAAVELRLDVVGIFTTDPERELVEYPRGRQVRLVE